MTVIFGTYVFKLARSKGIKSVSLRPRNILTPDVSFARRVYIQQVWTVGIRLRKLITYVVCFSGSAAEHGLWPPRTTRFHDHTQRRATIGRTPLDE
jgi:hypothetical protein